MIFTKHKWPSLAVMLVMALLLLCIPASANTSSSHAKKSKAESTKVEKKKVEKKKAKKKNNKKQAKKNGTKKSKAKKKKSKKDAKKIESQAAQKATQQRDTAESDSSVVKIDANDPKAFTKALLYEKDGVEFKVVGKKKSEDAPTMPPPAAEKPGDYFDFSTMLVPITHEAPIGSKYGIRDHRLHRGVDVSVIKDEPVVAALPGEVIISKYNKGGYGHYVLVEHENGIQTLYGHLSERSVQVGDRVFPGDVVGLAGNTGKSSAAHLHFEIRYGEINIDPEIVINFPKWELQKGADHLSKKQLTTAHYNIQKKLSKENVYVVHKGDTVEDVARWFNISVDALYRINNLKPKKPLKVGMKLRGCQ